MANDNDNDGIVAELDAIFLSKWESKYYICNYWEDCVYNINDKLVWIFQRIKYTKELKDKIGRIDYNAH